jgi:hypothetical protein
MLLHLLYIDYQYYIYRLASIEIFANDKNQTSRGSHACAKSRGLSRYCFAAMHPIIASLLAYAAAAVMLVITPGL